MINAGDLDQRLQIQANTPTKDAMGGLVDSWATAATVWGQVLPKDGSGREYLRGQQVNADVTHVIRMRYYSGLTVRHRILNEGSTRTFNIVQVVNADERLCEHVLAAKEVQ